MNHPDHSPKLPVWIFLITDAALLLAAWYIADRSAHPMSGNTAFAVVGCVVAGAIVGLVPLIARYERAKNETLDQRQRELEALGRTISSSAEQISIAANGFNEITDLAHKNLKQAELLPHRLQEKVAEFNAQLDNAREDDREELEKELAELRASETERLQLIAEKVHKAVLELTKLDTIAQKHVTARTELVERASDTLAKAHSGTAQALVDATAAATRQLAEAQAKALAAIDQKLADCTAAVVAAIGSAAAQARETLITTAPSSAGPDAATRSPNIDSEVPAKKPRKPRREEPESLSEDSSATAPSASVAMAETPAAATESTNTTEPAPLAPHTPENHEVSGSNAASIPSSEAAAAPEQVIPSPTVAEVSVETPPLPAAATPIAGRSPAEHIAADTAGPIERPTRKKTARKAPADTVENLTLELSTEEFSSPSVDDDSAGSAGDVNERVISSDGATRLVATAYIGIGNRLFIRGDGPGLSWEKGVPLQFVSIGKWRWETAEAAAPVTVKLYKNDETECATLGAITLDPGHQQEVVARF